MVVLKNIDLIIYQTTKSEYSDSYDAICIPNGIFYCLVPTS